MSERVMLVLIGGRSAVPAIAGVLQFLDDIDRVKFLLCKGEQYLEFQKNVEEVIRQESKDILIDNASDVISVDPNKFDEVYVAVEKLSENVEDLKYVNLTTVPQTMSISVYSYVQKTYKDVLLFTVNTDQSQIIPLVFGKKPVAFNKQITVENYIAMYGFNIFNKKIDAQDYMELAANYIVYNINFSSKIISVLRGQLSGKIPRTYSISKEEFTKLEISDNDLKEFFRQLQDFSIISKLDVDSNIVKFYIDKKDNYAFLSGDWLEIFVYYSSKKSGFDSVEMGVELDNYRGEIDVFCLNSANAMICECKTGGKLDSEDLTVLSSKAEKLGGNYCVKLFITSETKVGEIFINKARNNRVVVVSGSELINLSEILSKEMKFPTYPRR